MKKQKRAGEQFEKAFARLVDRRNPTHDPTCAGLFKMVGDMSGPDHFIAKNNNDDEIGKPPGDADAEISDDDDMEKECRNWMKANPEVKSKSQAYDAVSRTARGKAILRRDRMKTGIGV